MASITIRDLDARTQERLRIRAARHGRSMEGEARVILRSALDENASSSMGLGTTIHDRFRALGGVELELPPRELMRELPRSGRGAALPGPRPVEE